MLALGLCVALAAPGDTPAFAGTIKTTRGPTGKAEMVSLVTDDDGSLRIEGDMARELAKLASAKVEVQGVREGDSLSVKSYTIVEVSGVKPIVGYLVQTGSGFAIKEGEADDIPLSLPPRSRKRLHDQAGAKLWVYGKMLLSGELKVRKYGILRPPPTAKKE